MTVSEKTSGRPALSGPSVSKMDVPEVLSLDVVSTPAEIVGGILDMAKDLQTPTDRLYLLEGTLTSLWMNHVKNEWSIYLLIYEIRERGLFAPHATFEEWIGDFTRRVQESEQHALRSFGAARRTIYDRLRMIRFALVGLGRHPDELAEAAPGRVLKLAGKSDYNPITGEIRDDEDPEIAPGKWGRRAAIDAWEATEGMSTSEAIALISDVSGQERLYYDMDVFWDNERQCALLSDIRVIQGDGIYRLNDYLPQSVALDLIKRLGLTPDGLTLRKKR